MSERTIVLSPAPTANGDLHLGHIAGPFLAADVYTRSARAAGAEVLFGTGVQDTPTYVVTTAHRLGMRPKDLVARSADQVSSTLSALGIEVDGFTGDDSRFVKVVTGFVERLRPALRLKPVAFPFSRRTGEYLMDGYVRGGCPVCLAEGCAGLCESCGHPVAASDLVGVTSTVDPSESLELREVPVLVLPLEDYRDRLAAYYERVLPTMRPHMAQLIRELLARPLPDYPITYPTSWGIPAPFPEVAGQVVNPNAEPAAWSAHAAALAAERRGGVLAAEDEMLRGGRLVYFLGFDNTFPFAVAMVAAMMAAGYPPPDRFLTNEFYELESEKFSTSRGHVVWGRDLVAEVPRDIARFHLAATSPEHQRTDFSRATLERVTRSRLVRPWNQVADRVAGFVDLGELTVSAPHVLDRIGERFAACYALDTFSLNRAAATLAEQLARLAAWEAGPAEAGDYCAQVYAVLRWAAPILVDLGAHASSGALVAVDLPRMG